MLFMALGGICYLLSFICYIIILIDAFKDAIWKGLLCFFCGIYGLYYSFAEFDHEKKWLIVAGSFLGGGLGYVLMMVGAGSLPK